MGFWLINAVLLLIIIVLLILLSWVWPPDSPWSPWWRTDKKTARAVCKLADISSKDVVYELGSGDGTLLAIAAKEFGAKGVGIEIDPIRYFISTIILRCNRVADKVHIIKKNFFTVDISQATVLFVYLVPKALDRLLPKLKKELRQRTRIISLKYKMSLPLVKEDKKNHLYLYKI